MSAPVIVIPSLAAACGVMMLMERQGLPTTLALPLKGDIKRESRFLAQYGQLVCTVIVVVLVLQLDPLAARRGLIWPTVIGVALATISATALKKIFGRVRPGRENAGRFLGFTLAHANYRESFPSSHSASAAALSAGLAWMYPQAALTFWALALVCAALRYLLDAHWPSDVLGGLALGYLAAFASWWVLVHH